MHRRPLAGTPHTLQYGTCRKACAHAHLFQCMNFALCTFNERTPHQGCHSHARCLRAMACMPTLVESPACPCMLHATWPSNDQPEHAPTTHLLADIIFVFDLVPTL